MTWQINLLDLLYMIALLTALIVLAYSWSQRHKPIARPLLLVIVGVVIWLSSNLIEARFLAEAPRLFWNNMQYVGIVLVPAGWFLFALTYAGWAKWLNKRAVSLLFIEPILIVILVWTSEWHTIFRQFMALNVSERYPFWEWAPGPAFWVHIAYTYLLLIAGIVVLVQVYRQSASFYRRQIRILLVAVLIPWLTNALFLLAGGRNVDPTSISFAATVALLTWGIFSYGLVEIMPVAFNQMLQEIKDGVLVLDEKNRIVYANPAFKRILGTAEPITGKPITEFLDRWPDLPQQFQDVQNIDTEISLSAENGASQHYQLSISPLDTGKKRASGRLIMLHEITIIKQTELRLHEARRAAEAANQTKSLFLATMSHELRTPLAAIIGYSELIEEKNEAWDHANIMAKVSQIRDAAAQLNAIIGDILDMSRIEAGHMTLSVTSFSLEPLIADVIAAIQPKAREKANALQTNITPEADEMIADRQKVRQILLSILSNAVKFTEQGQITLTVNRVSAANQQAGAYCFQISDTGIGIPPEKLPSLFKPFVQLDSSRTRKHGGSGLGLAISYSYCQMMGGDMRVESELGRGTTVYVRLPERVVNAKTTHT
jgi:PAS domain S-box-containing protein